MDNCNPSKPFSLRRSLSPLFLAAAFAYCTFIFYLSSISTFPVPPPFPHFDKIVHFFLFGGLSATIATGLRRAERKYTYKMLVALSVGFSTLYGVSDEIHQLFVPYRTFSIGDITADALGAAAAALFLLVIYGGRKEHQKTTIKGGVQ